MRIRDRKMSVNCERIEMRFSPYVDVNLTSLSSVKYAAKEVLGRYTELFMYGKAGCRVLNPAVTGKGRIGVEPRTRRL